MSQKERNNSDQLLLHLAWNLPGKLPAQIKKQYQLNSKDQVNHKLPALVAAFLQNHEMETVRNILPRIVKVITQFSGVQTAYNLLSRMEVAFQIRQPRVGIYDHTFHLIGGGQKYGCTIAYALQNGFEVTLIANREVTHQELERWYNLDLSQCQIKLITLPFFEQGSFHEIDPSVITVRTENPFHLISRESGNYDIFINNSMLEMVYPLSNISLLICHFPERRRSPYFYAEQYTHIVYNSQYTAEWIKNKWKINPTRHIYPPVDMGDSDTLPKKENIILSVARFEVGGSKQQLRMMEIFSHLTTSYPQFFKKWRLILAGGSVEHNPYLEKIHNYLAMEHAGNIELKVNIPFQELKSLYRKGKIFWHFCGLSQSDPALVEHFGMSIVEAMQNWCVPIVFDGGGQREIVEQEISGFRFTSPQELKEFTLRVMRDDNFWKKLSKGAYARGKCFTKEIFISEVKKLFAKIMKEYTLPKAF